MIHEALSLQPTSCSACSGECHVLEAGGCARHTRLLRALWATLYTGRGYFEITIGNERRHISTDDVDGFITTLAGAARLRERVRLGAAVHSSIDEAGELSSRVLWVRLESAKAVEQLDRFQPRPTLILRDGDNVKRTAFWELSKTLSWWWTLQANERLAHRLGGVRSDGDPSYRFAPPFAPLPRDRHIVVEHFEPVYYRADQVVGDARPDRRALPDAPARDAWRQSKPAALAA